MKAIRDLEDYFEFQRLGTDWKTEALAGATTFLTMSYIIFVNPAILSEAGMNASGVAAATCLASAFGSILMGLWARYPIALAPGMGINAYFTYAVVLGMGIPWQTALGAVFLSGVIFLLLTWGGIREKVMRALPNDLYAAVAAGIGLFIALIGLRNAGLIVPSEATLVTLGNLGDPMTLMALFGLVVVAGLMVWNVKSAMLLGILATTTVGWFSGLVEWRPGEPPWDALGETAFQFRLGDALALGFVEIVFVFLFVDLFDTLGTVIAVLKKARLFNSDNEIPRIQRVLAADASATIVGAMSGTSTVVSYIESASGITAGGRSGFTAVVAGFLFLLSLFIAPVIGVIPVAATAPALILVGCLMMSTVREVDWDDFSTAAPAFMTIVMIPLTYSIANGLAIGVIAYDLLKVLRGRGGEAYWLLHVLAALFLARFVYLGAG